MKANFVYAAVSLLALSAVAPAVTNAQEDSGETKQLFNGKNLDGWQTTGNWVVEEDGSLAIKPRPGEEGWKRYNDYLWTEQKYGNFILELEYKHPPGGNSGVFLRVQDREEPVTTGIEVQILDSYGKEPPLTAHDNAGVISSTAPTKNMSKPAGEWNKMRIRSQGDRLAVELNGEQVSVTNLSESPLKDRPAEGYIGLQDHGQMMWFRNVRLKPLTAASTQ